VDVEIIYRSRAVDNGREVDWTPITNWAENANWLAIATGVLALSTTVLAVVTWRGVHENKHLIQAAQRQADVLWANSVPHLLPETVEPYGGGDELQNLTISYAAGTVPARAITAWVGWKGRVWIGGQNLLSVTDNKVKRIGLVQSRAGSEPPKDWDQWLRQTDDHMIFRVVIRWAGPEDHITERAWQVEREQGYWAEVPAALRGSP
jgi:hypothetical protein